MGMHHGGSLHAMGSSSSKSCRQINALTRFDVVLNNLMHIYRYIHNFINSLPVDPACQFKPTYPSLDHVRLESVKYPGIYLVLENGVFVGGTPVGDNDILEILPIGHTEGIILRSTVGTDCHLAFDSDGEPLTSPCGTSKTDHATHFAVVTI